MNTLPLSVPLAQHARKPAPQSSGLIGFFRHHGAWAPGVRLFRRLDFKAKAMLISAVFVVPLAAVFSVWLPTARADLETARVEAQGVTAYQAWLPVMR